MPSRTPLIAALVVLAGIAVAGGVREASKAKSTKATKVQPNCLVYKGVCLGWTTREVEFSPDGKHLYFVYWYRQQRTQSLLTRRIVGRYHLKTGKIEPFRYSCDVNYSGIALSPDGRYMAMRVSSPQRLTPMGKGRRRYAVRWQEKHIEIVNLKTGAVTKVTDDRFRSYWNLLFSPDSQRLYFNQLVNGAIVVRLAAYDLKAKKVIHIYPQIASKRWIPSDFPGYRNGGFWTYKVEGGIWKWGNSNFHRNSNSVVFLGMGLKPDPVPALAREYDISISSIKSQSLMYRFDLATKKISLHDINSYLLKQNIGNKFSFQNKRISGLKINSKSEIFFSISHGRIENVKLYYYDGEKIQFLAPTPNKATDFAVSPLKRYIAYTYQVPETYSVSLRYLDRITGKWRIVDLGENLEALLIPATRDGCV